MKTPLPRRLHALLGRLPEPPRALRLARLLIPLCIAVGLIAEPALRWFLRSIGAGA